MSDLSDEDRHALWLQRINRKGLEVATKLADLKAGQNITLADMESPGLDLNAMSKEERLRAFLDLVNDARSRLLNGTFGQCLSCSAPLPPAALDEVPWMQRCADCERIKAAIR